MGVTGKYWRAAARPLPLGKQATSHKVQPNKKSSDNAVQFTVDLKFDALLLLVPDDVQPLPPQHFPALSIEDALLLIKHLVPSHKRSENLALQFHVRVGRQLVLVAVVGSAGVCICFWVPHLHASTIGQPHQQTLFRVVGNAIAIFECIICSLTCLEATSADSQVSTHQQTTNILAAIPSHAALPYYAIRSVSSLHALHNP